MSCFECPALSSSFQDNCARDVAVFLEPVRDSARTEIVVLEALFATGAKFDDLVQFGWLFCPKSNISLRWLRLRAVLMEFSSKPVAAIPAG